MTDLISFEPPEPSELGSLLNGYEVTALIATGGMGAVYSAKQVSLDRPVAIKLLPSEFGDETFREQFQAEARAMAKLNHPNLIGIYDFGQADGMPYIVMELVEGKSLYYSCYQTAIEQQTACELVIEICEGLAHAHKAGIVHRDIKPANILLDLDAHAKIGDFGLASHDADNPDGESLAYGTPGYAAPEILENPSAIGVPSDIFAVGVILYELLTGFLPEQPPRPASTVKGCDPRLDKVIRTATRRNPRMRYQNAQDMADELKQLLPTLGKSPGGMGKATTKTLLRLESDKPRPTNPKVTTTKVPLTKLTTNVPESERVRRETALQETIAPAPMVPVSSGGNWPIIRNLMIIALLVPALIFAIGKYQDKQKEIAIEEEKVLNEKRAKADAENARLNEIRSAAKKKREQEEAEKARARALAAALADEIHDPKIERTPIQELAYLRADLSNGKRERFPKGTFERGNDFLFVVDQPMSWSQAAQYAEDHGGHLATPDKPADLASLANTIGDHKRVWIGGGAVGRNDWGWVNGKKWLHRNPSTTLGSCAALSSSGLIKARPNGEKNPFIIQWSGSGKNEGTLTAQLARLQATLGSPSPAWPPGTVVQQNRHYVVVHRSLTWDEADLVANSGRGHLAVASDGLEMNFIRDTLKAALGIDESAWLGARRNNDSWYWITREPWQRANWQANAPDGGPEDSALHFVNSQSDPGWNDTSPDSQEVEAFLIEWSNDETNYKKSSGSVADNNKNAGAPSSARENINNWRSVIRKLLMKKIDAHQDQIGENKAYVERSLRSWLRTGSKSLVQAHGARIENVQAAITAGDGIPADLDFQTLPNDAQKYIMRGLQTQEGHRTRFEKEISDLKNSYLNKLLGEYDRLKKAGLNSQAALIQAEIDGIGQTNDSFRSFLTN